jgi:hypothetical protein
MNWFDDHDITPLHVTYEEQVNDSFMVDHRIMDYLLRTWGQPLRPPRAEPPQPNKGRPPWTM